MSNFTLTTKIYFSALYFWAHVLYYCSLIFTNILWFFITYMPDSFIVYKIPFIKSKTDEIDVIDARLIKNKENIKDTENCKIIKNTVKLLINVYWDNTINNLDYNRNELDRTSPGGIDLEKIFDTLPEFKNSVIWIKYIKKIKDILEKDDDIESLCSNNDSNNKNSNIDIIKEILVDSMNKIGDIENDNNKYDIYKNKDLTKNYKNIFNEISF